MFCNIIHTKFCEKKKGYNKNLTSLSTSNIQFFKLYFSYCTLVLCMGKCDTGMNIVVKKSPFTCIYSPSRFYPSPYSRYGAPYVSLPGSKGSAIFFAAHAILLFYCFATLPNPTPWKLFFYFILCRESTLDMSHF